MQPWPRACRPSQTLGDFTDKYTGSLADRETVFEADASHWGHDWIALPNPEYGSIESAPFGSNYKLSADQPGR